MENIQFDSIPASIRKPGKYFEFNTKLAVRTLPANLIRVLIVGQKLAAGSGDALSPTPIYSDQDAATIFGNGSNLHLMCRAAIQANAYLDLTAVGLADADTAVASAGAVVVGGPATGSGSFKLYIGNHMIEVGIASADTADAIATALSAEIAKYGDLPVSAAVDGVDTTKVNFTARNLGTIGDQIGIDTDITAAGVTATVTAMTGGAVDPDSSTALDTVFAEQYDIIITPYNDQTGATALRDYLDSVSGPMEQRPGRGVFATTGALADATTLSGQVNGGRMNAPYLRATRSPAYEVAAAYGAVMASESDPARPLNTLALTGISAPAVDQRLSRTEQESCLNNGVSPLEVGPGEVVRIVRAVTTYTQDAQGIDDISLLDTTTIATLDYTRKACRDRIALRFPREKLNSRTPNSVRSELLDVLELLEPLEILENVAANAAGVVVQKNLQDPNRLDAKIPTDVVNGLHVFAARIDLLL